MAGWPSPCLSPGMQVDKAMAGKDRSIALCLVRHTISALSHAAQAPPFWQTRVTLLAGWLATYLPLGVLRPLKLSPSKAYLLAVVDCAALYPCVKRACVTNRSMSVRAFLLGCRLYCGYDPLRSSSGGGHALSESGMQ